jgi:hypothetical protein
LFTIKERRQKNWHRINIRIHLYCWSGSLRCHVLCHHSILPLWLFNAVCFFAMWFCLLPFKCLVLRVQCTYMRAPARVGPTCQWLDLINASIVPASLLYYIILVTSKFNSSNHFTYHDLSAPRPRYLCVLAAIHTHAPHAPCQEIEMRGWEGVRPGWERGTWWEKGERYEATCFWVKCCLVQGLALRFEDDPCLHVLFFCSSDLQDLGPGFIPLRNSFKIIPSESY